jgi:hypothetical protein
MYTWPARAIRRPVRKMTRPGEVGAPPPADDPRRWLIAIVSRSSKEVPVQSHHRRLRRTRIAATSLVIAALAAPAANARVALDGPATHQGPASEPQRSALVVSATPDKGFDWGSAGIGAAAGAGLVLVGAGSFALTHQGRLRLAR